MFKDLVIISSSRIKLSSLLIIITLSYFIRPYILIFLLN